MDGGDLTCVTSLTLMEIVARVAVIDDQKLLTILSDWSGNGLETSELQALGIHGARP